MNEIKLDQAVATVLDDHPELLDLLVDMGFTPLNNPAMRETVGRVVSLKNGCKLAGIPIDQLKKTLRMNGYTISEEDHHDRPTRTD